MSALLHEDDIHEGCLVIALLGSAEVVSLSQYCVASRKGPLSWQDKEGLFLPRTNAIVFLKMGEADTLFMLAQLCCGHLGLT